MLSKGRDIDNNPGKPEKSIQAMLSQADNLSMDIRDIRFRIEPQLQEVWLKKHNNVASIGYSNVASDLAELPVSLRTQYGTILRTIGPR